MYNFDSGKCFEDIQQKLRAWPHFVKSTFLHDFKSYLILSQISKINFYEMKGFENFLIYKMALHSVSFYKKQVKF